MKKVVVIVLVSLSFLFAFDLACANIGIFYAKYEISILSEPFFGSAEIEKITPGTELTAFEEKNAWYYVTTKTGRAGWVAKKWILPKFSQKEKPKNIEKDKRAKIRELEAKVKPIPAYKVDENLSLYKQLLELDPTNKKYKNKVAHYQRAKRELNKKKYTHENTAVISDRDIDKLTTYAVILGRAIGCGISTEYESKRVGQWLDSKLPPGSAKQKTYLPIFVSGVQYHAEQQASGKSPDTCSQVRRTFNNMVWP